MNVGLFQSVWTVLALVIFVAIVIWAWSDKRKDVFDKASRMALDDDESIDNFKRDSEKIRGHHG